MTSTVMVRIDGLVRAAEQRPHDAVMHGGAEREPEQPAGGPVGEPLRPRRRGLRLGDQPLDAGQRGVVADGGDPHPQRGVGGDGAGDDVVAGARGGPAGTRR